MDASTHRLRAFRKKTESQQSQYLTREHSMKRVLLIGAAALAMAAAAPAMAHVSVGIAIGVPGIVVAPAPVYYPPVQYVAPPPVYYPPVRYVAPPPVVYAPYGGYYRRGWHEWRGRHEGWRGRHWRHHDDDDD
jgi:hypothetical protein